MIIMAQRHAQEFASRATQEAIEQRSQQRSHFAAASTEDVSLAVEPALPSGFSASPQRPSASATPAQSVLAPSQVAESHASQVEPAARVVPASQAVPAPPPASTSPPVVAAAPPVVHHGPLLAAAADLSDGQDGNRLFEMQTRVHTLNRELAETQRKLARACGEAHVVRELDLSGLSELRAEIVATYTAALDRIDDRRVELRCQAEARKSEDSGLCVACLARTANALLQPCRHMCVCTVCAPQCGDACPLCRRNVQNFIEVVGVS